MKNNNNKKLNKIKSIIEIIIIIITCKINNIYSDAEYRQIFFTYIHYKG